MNDKKRISKIKIYRFDPETDSHERFDEFKVPYEQGNTVMNILTYIYENLDSSLAFRIGCSGAGHQRCGACPVVVNNKPVLSCKYLAEEEMTISPHPKFEIIKDLAIDFERMKKKTKEGIPKVKISVDSEKCDGCRDCVFVCPMKVYELKKQGDKVVSFPVDLNSCCGESCNQCAIFCKNSAIVVEDINKEN